MSTEASYSRANLPLRIGLAVLSVRGVPARGLRADAGWHTPLPTGPSGPVSISLLSRLTMWPRASQSLTGPAAWGAGQSGRSAVPQRVGHARRSARSDIASPPSRPGCLARARCQCSELRGPEHSHAGRRQDARMGRSDPRVAPSLGSPRSRESAPDGALRWPPGFRTSRRRSLRDLK